MVVRKTKDEFKQSLSETELRRISEAVEMAEQVARSKGLESGKALRICRDYLDSIQGEKDKKLTAGVWRKYVRLWEESSLLDSLLLEFLTQNKRGGEAFPRVVESVSDHVLKVLNGAVVAVSIMLSPQKPVIHKGTAEMFLAECEISHKALRSLHNDATPRGTKSRRQVGPEEEKKQASVDTKITGPLPSAETVIEDKFEIFKATLTAHELSLLVALNRLSTSEILLQLKEHGISNKEVWRRLERKSPNEMSLIANGRRIPGEKLRAAILEIALQEIKPGKSN